MESIRCRVTKGFTLGRCHTRRNRITSTVNCTVSRISTSLNRTSGTVSSCAGRCITSSSTRERSIRLIKQCFRTGLCRITRAHREDESCRTCHRLNTANVIRNKVRHRTANQTNQYRIKRVNASASGVSRRGFAQERRRLIPTSTHAVFTSSMFLVFEKSGDSGSLVCIADFRQVRMLKNWLPLLLKFIEIIHLFLSF